MRPWKRDEPLVRRSKRIKQLELPVAREQLVSSHCMWKRTGMVMLGASRTNRGAMLTAAGEEEAWRIPYFPSTVQRKRSPGACSHVREPKTRSHGETDVGDTVGGNNLELAQSAQRRIPVLDDAIGDFVDASCGQHRLILRPVELCIYTVSVKGTINGNGSCHLQHAGKPPTQHELPSVRL